MTFEPTDGRADSTRRQLLRAASHQFARHAYQDVGLEDILNEAELTKGAMYFHFRSKRALAVAIIERQVMAGTEAVEELFTKQLSGLETLIDFCYLIAVRDLGKDSVRAALHLLSTVGRTGGLQANLLGSWIRAFTEIAGRAITEGDVVEQCDPEDLGRLIVSMYLGLRQTSDLDDSERFLLDLERCCTTVLPGILRPDRIDYFRQFIRRRTALAVGATSTRVGSD